MTSYPYAVTVSKNEQLSIRSYWQKSDHTRCVDDEPNYRLRGAGVLRYNRESDHDSKTNVPLECPTLSDCAVMCEYCGEKATPSLNLSWLHGPEKDLEFCCIQQQELCVLLVNEINLVEEKRVLMIRKKLEDRKVFDIQFGFRARFEFKIKETFEPYEAEPTNVVRFRFSTTVARSFCALCSSKVAKRCYRAELHQTKAVIPCCDHKRPHFGLCYHRYQHDEEFQHKYYSSGKKFLTVFNDGSAHVYYPSGNLAMVVAVTAKKGKVCVVYDDCDNPEPQMRALFQSDGKATCYHSNGNIWLYLDSSGGQSYEQGGAKACRWYWDGPLHPVFLSLNRIIGVRVFARNQVFVSFLAQGTQAKFSVGACCVQASFQGEPIRDSNFAAGLSITKDMLLVLAIRNKTHLAIQNLQHCLMLPSHPQLPKTSTTSYFHVVVQRLLELSANISMTDSERAFFHKCLQE